MTAPWQFFSTLPFNLSVTSGGTGAIIMLRYSRHSGIILCPAGVSLHPATDMMAAMNRARAVSIHTYSSFR